MSLYTASNLHTQNDLLLNNLMEFYKRKENLDKMIRVINGESKISLRIVDWFVTNYAKKYYTIFEQPDATRFKVYNDYKLKLKAYSKRRLDPFCRWDRITIPYDTGSSIETTIGQLNFFKWAIENRILDYIETHYQTIEDDMNERNSTSKRKTPNDTVSSEESIPDNTKTRKKREELSISACKCIKKETVKIVVKFN